MNSPGPERKKWNVLRDEKAILIVQLSPLLRRNKTACKMARTGLAGVRAGAGGGGGERGTPGVN